MPRTRKMRLSIRYQIVLLVSGLILGAMGMYLTFATRLFTTSTLDTLKASNVQLAGTLADEVRVNVRTTVDKMLYFAAEQSLEVKRPAGPLLEADPDLLGVEIWSKSGGSFMRTFHDEPRDRLMALGVPSERLEVARNGAPPDVEQVQRSGGVLLQNASQPALPLLRLWAMSPDGLQLVVADLRPARLLSTFGHSLGRAKAYLVDSRGVVLVHPDESVVIARADRSREPGVKPALEADDVSGQTE